MIGVMRNEEEGFMLDVMRGKCGGQHEGEGWLTSFSVEMVDCMGVGFKF